jgi:hypothetical protein
VNEAQPDRISLQEAAGRLGVRASVRALRAGGITAPILVGGGAIENDAHARRVSADGWSGPDARSAVDAAEDAARRAARGRR